MEFQDVVRRRRMVRRFTDEAGLDWEEALAAREEVQALLGARPIESLVELPPMTDADMKPVMNVLARLFPSAYLTDNNLLVLHVCRMVSLSLRYGNTHESAIAYSSSCEAAPLASSASAMRTRLTSSCRRFSSMR